MATHVTVVPFSAVDKDHDGNLSRAELQAAAQAVHDKAAHESSHAPPALADAAHATSAASSHEHAAHESSVAPPALAFTAQAARGSPLVPAGFSRADVRSLFRALDANNDGRVDERELDLVADSRILGSTLPAGTPRPDQVPRRCTDAFCAVIFLLATAAMVAGLAYGYTKKELKVYGRQGTLFPEFLVDQGAMICGVSAEVKWKPFLFFCQAKGMHQLNYSHAICVEDCSRRSEILQSCTWDYKAFPVAGRLCVPEDDTLRGDTFDEEVQNVVKRHPRYTWIMGLHYFLRDLDIILVGAAIAFLVGLVYATVVAASVKSVRTAAFFVSFGFLVTAAAFGTFSYLTIRFGFQQRHDEIGAPLHGIAGALMGVVAVCALVGTAVSPQVVNSAGPFVLSLSECAKQMGALTLEPVLNSIGRMLLGVVLVLGLVVILSNAEVNNDEKTRQVTYTHEWWTLAMAAGEVVVVLWWLEFLKALTHYTSSYITQAWYVSKLDLETEKKEVDGYGPLGGALQTAWSVHLGTLSLGASILPWVCENWRCSRAWHPSTVIHGIEHLHRDAYIAVAGYGSSFFVAARQLAREFKGPYMYGSTSKHMKHGIQSGKVYVPPAAAVDACTWVMSTSVRCLAMSLASAAAFAMMTFWSKYSDYRSPEYVRDPLALLVVTMLVALLVVSPFVQVPDMVLHSILFCFEVEMEAHEEWKEQAVRFHRIQEEGVVRHAAEVAYNRSCGYFFSSGGDERPLVVPEVEGQTQPPNTEDLKARILFNAREAGVEMKKDSF